MDYNCVADHQKFLAPNGVTLNVEEKMNVTIALGTLQAELCFERLFLWGKIEGKEILEFC